jgi:hypothetical protein
MSNEYFWNNTLLLLTFDENESYGIQNKMFSILLGGAVPAHLVGTVDHTVSIVQSSQDIIVSSFYSVVERLTNMYSSTITTRQSPPCLRTGASRPSAVGTARRTSLRLSPTRPGESATTIRQGLALTGYL